jgi:hypothetical protein
MHLLSLKRFRLWIPFRIKPDPLLQNLNWQQCIQCSPFHASLCTLYWASADWVIWN